MTDSLLQTARRASMATDTSKTIADEAAIIEKLEGIITSSINAFNNRDLDPQSAGWSSFANSWTGRMGDDIVPLGQPSKLRDWLSYAQSTTTVNPDIKVHIIDMTTIVDQSKRTATTYLTTDRTGKADQMDIRKQSVSTVDFRCMSGEWKAVRFERMPGGGVDPF